MAIRLSGVPVEVEKQKPIAVNLRSKEEISDHFLKVNRDQKPWMLDAADSVCEDMFAVMASLKTARNACITLDTLTARTSEKLWLKVLVIDAECEEEIQSYWVLTNLMEMCRYWTPALIKASKTLLPEQESQEFINFISKRNSGLEDQLQKTQNAIMTQPIEITLADLVQQGATVTIHRNVTSTPGTDMNTNHINPISNEQAVETPLPQIDEQLFDKNIAENKKMDGIFHRAYTGVKNKVVQAKEVVTKLVTSIYPFWKFIALFTVVVLLVLLAIFMRRNVVVNFNAANVWDMVVKFTANSWVVVKNVAIALTRTVKGWFAATSTVVIETGAVTASAV